MTTALVASPADPPAPPLAAGEHPGDQATAVAALDAYAKAHPVVPWERRPAMLDQIVGMGWASHRKHAANILRKLTVEGKADPRWTDQAALVAVEMYRRLNPAGHPRTRAMEKLQGGN